MRFRAIINGVPIERNWTWEEVARAKEELKRLGFKWSGEAWIGEAESSTDLAKLSRILGLRRDEEERIRKTFVIDAPDLPSEYSHCMEAERRIVSVPCVIKSIMRRGDLIIKARNFEEYSELVLKEVERTLRSREAIEAARAMLSRDLFERRREWRRAEACRGVIRLNFVSSNLLRDLFSLVIKYNRVDKDGNLVEESFRAINRSDVANIDGKWTIRFPVFMEDEVTEIIARHGFIISKCPPEPRRITVPRVDVKLLGFQEDAVNAWVRNGYRGTIVVPTGGGKTYIALKALATLSVRTIVLVVTSELMNQWRDRIMRSLGIDAGRLGASKSEIREVTVAIYNSAIRHIDEIKDEFDLAIFDEAHHVPAETFKEVAFRLSSPYRLALSATPEREDENQHLIYLSSGDIVFKASYVDMVRAGLVVPIRHYRIYVDLDRDEAREYRGGGDNPIALRNIAAKAKAKLGPIIDIAKAEAGSKIIIFTQYIDQAEEIYESLGADAELITSRVSGRSDIFARFSEGKSRILVTTTVLDEGIDVPDADVAIIASGTGSRRQMIQRIGRVVRASPGKREARVYELIARGTIEEALSEMRHSDEVEEIECKKFLVDDLHRLINHVKALRSRGNIEYFL